jgi:hypothetical protein
MSWHYRGWQKLMTGRSYEDLMADMPEEGDLTLRIPDFSPWQYDRALQVPDYSPSQKYQPITLHWRRGYQPDTINSGNPTPSQYAYPACWSEFKFSLDDIVRCTFSYDGKPLQLNLILNHLYICSVGSRDETHINEQGLPQLPCWELFMRLYQGLPVEQFFYPQENLWQLEGGSGAGPGVVSQTITYSFDIDNLQCTYIQDYREDRLD